MAYWGVSVPEGFHEGLREAMTRYEAAELRPMVGADVARDVTHEVVVASLGRAHEQGYEISVPQVRLFTEHVMLLALAGAKVAEIGEVVRVLCPPPVF